MTSLNSFVMELASNEDGAVVVEYVFLLIFIVMVALGAIKTFGGSVVNKMGDNNNSVSSAFGP
ncbi:Flp family type IVb pilin [Capsulimonas corticalis]|nr:hypothetical protein [Capsulimonas corticalis]